MVVNPLSAVEVKAATTVEVRPARAEVVKACRFVEVNAFNSGAVRPPVCLLVRPASCVVVRRFATVVVRPAIWVVESAEALSALSTVEVMLLICAVLRLWICVEVSPPSCVEVKLLSAGVVAPETVDAEIPANAEFVRACRLVDVTALRSVRLKDASCLLVRTPSWLVVRLFRAVVDRPPICVLESFVALSSLSTVVVEALSCVVERP